MKKVLLIMLLSLSALLYQCSTTTTTTVAEDGPDADPVIYSFSFMGCNRVNRGDVTDSIPSTANKGVLQRIFDEMRHEDRQPELFFFLGDLVLAETDTSHLNSQLKAWVDLYANNPVSQSGIEMVAVPGNHEMLYARKMEIDGKEKWKEFPLAFSTEVWMKHMSGFMPADRDVITGKDSLVNRMTFSFTRKNIGFIVMNTDTYNPPSPAYQYGREGMIPLTWILNKIQEYQQEPSVEHIFVLGHKPYYVSGKPETGHKGLPEGPVLWPAMNKAGVNAMLSAHVHDYQRMQPGGKGAYQVIAGNGGSEGTATFFGYTTIHIHKSGRTRLVAKGFDVGDPYDVVTDGPTTIRDSTTLVLSANANPYQNN